MTYGMRCVAWRGVVWCGVVWCGVVWCGVGQAGALPDTARTDNGGTPVLVAAQSGYTGVVGALLKAGVGVHFQPISHRPLTCTSFANCVYCCGRLPLSVLYEFPPFLQKLPCTFTSRAMNSAQHGHITGYDSCPASCET
jgi:hypothetical protein